MKKPQKKHFIEDDIILVHKPMGLTSFDIVSKMRKILGTRKIGHAGTLDPLASGLMILGVNGGTKKLKNYLGLDKVYSVDICLGKSTTTGDAEGEVVETKQYKNDISQRKIEKAFQDFLGEHFFLAPLYSAVKILGKPLYKYARENKEPPFIPEKKMHLKKFSIENIFKKNECLIIRAEVEVASGTYIRTLAEELGKELGYPASIIRLHRKSIDKYLDINSFHIQVKKNNKKYDIMNMYSVIKRLFQIHKK